MTTAVRSIAILRTLAFAGAATLAGASAVFAQSSPAPAAPAAITGNAETRFSDAWYAKFAPRVDTTPNARPNCFFYDGQRICAVTGSVPSHGKTSTLKSVVKPVIKPKR